MYFPTISRGGLSRDRARTVPGWGSTDISYHGFEHDRFPQDAYRESAADRPYRLVRLSAK